MPRLTKAPLPPRPKMNGTRGGGEVKARATIDVHHFFSGIPPIWELKTAPNKSNLEKNKTAMIPDEKSHGLVGTE